MYSVITPIFDSSNGLQFDGINDYITIPHNASLNFGTSEFSISLILQTKNTLQTGLLYEKWCDDTIPFGQGFEIAVSSTGVISIGLFVTGDPNRRFVSIVTPTNTILPNTKYHIVFIKTNTTGIIYVNNNIVSTTISWIGTPLAFSSINVNNLSRVYIGVELYKENVGSPLKTYYFNGYMFDIKAFNKALTTSEIFTLYTKRGQIISASAIANCVLDLRFDDKQGTTLTDKYSNNGTLTNFTNTTLGVSNQWVDKYRRALSYV